MAQRVDVIVDGVRRNAGQLSSSPALLARIARFIQTAREVRIVRSAGPTLPPPAAPPPPSLQKQATCIVFCADHAIFAQYAPAHYAWALSADPGEEGEAQDGHSIADIVKDGRDQHRRIVAWGNQTQIGIARIKQFCADHQLDGCIYQSETQDELAALGVSLDGSIVAGSLVADEKVIHIGNPNAWTEAQRATVAKLVVAGRMAVIVEVYNNVMPWVWPNTYDSQGVPVASWCIGIYDGASESPKYGRYTPVADYRAHCDPAQWLSVSVYHASGFSRQPGDWSVLP